MRTTKWIDGRTVAEGEVWPGHRQEVAFKTDVVCLSAEPEVYEGRVYVMGVHVHTTAPGGYSEVQRLGSEWLAKRFTALLED